MSNTTSTTSTTAPEKVRRAKGPSAPVESAPVESATADTTATVEMTAAPVEMTAADRIGAAMLAAADAAASAAAAAHLPATDENRDRLVAAGESAPVEMVESVTAILRTVRTRDRDAVTAMLAESDAPGAIRRAVAALVTAVPFGADAGDNVRTAWADALARFATATAHAAAHLPADAAALVAALSPAALAASGDAWASAAAVVAGWEAGRGRRATSDGSATRSAPVLSGRTVPAGLSLVATYRGATLAATTVAAGESVEYRLTNGETYPAASPAAVAAVRALGTFTGSRISLRGTTFWHVGTVDGPTLADYVAALPVE